MDHDDYDRAFLHGTPDELIRQLEGMRSRSQMERMSAGYQLYRLFEELSEDQLRALNTIMSTICATDDPTALAGHFGGVATWALVTRFGMDPVTGRPLPTPDETEGA